MMHQNLNVLAVRLYGRLGNVLMTTMATVCLAAKFKRKPVFIVLKDMGYFISDFVGEIIPYPDLLNTYKEMGLLPAEFEFLCYENEEEVKEAYKDDLLHWEGHFYNYKDLERLLEEYPDKNIVTNWGLMDCLKYLDKSIIWPVFHRVIAKKAEHRHYDYPYISFCLRGGDVHSYNRDDEIKTSIEKAFYLLRNVPLPVVYLHDQQYDDFGEKTIKRWHVPFKEKEFSDIRDKIIHDFYTIMNSTYAITSVTTFSHVALYLGEVQANHVYFPKKFYWGKRDHDVYNPGGWIAV